MLKTWRVSPPSFQYFRISSFSQHGEINECMNSNKPYSLSAFQSCLFPFSFTLSNSQKTEHKQGQLTQSAHISTLTENDNQNYFCLSPLLFLRQEHSLAMMQQALAPRASSHVVSIVRNMWQLASGRERAWRRRVGLETKKRKEEKSGQRLSDEWIRGY